jgi:hypothetical protein
MADRNGRVTGDRACPPRRSPPVGKVWGDGTLESDRGLTFPAAAAQMAFLSAARGLIVTVIVRSVRSVTGMFASCQRSVALLPDHGPDLAGVMPAMLTAGCGGTPTQLARKLACACVRRALAALMCRVGLESAPRTAAAHAQPGRGCGAREHQAVNGIVQTGGRATSPRDAIGFVAITKSCESAWNRSRAAGFTCGWSHSSSRTGIHAAFRPCCAKS